MGNSRESDEFIMHFRFFTDAGIKLSKMVEMFVSMCKIQPDQWLIMGTSEYGICAEK